MVLTRSLTVGPPRQTLADYVHAGSDLVSMTGPVVGLIESSWRCKSTLADRRFGVGNRQKVTKTARVPACTSPEGFCWPP